MGNTKIDYLDKCINIIVGCGNGCWYCWARNRYAPRFAHNCSKCGTFTPHFHEERLKLIDRIKKPSIVGLNFMGDTWDPNVKPEWRYKMFSKLLSKEEDKNDYIVLTKQPQNIKGIELGPLSRWFLPGKLWVGVSIESIDHMDRWIALSQKEYIQHKIISFEPVLDIHPVTDIIKLFEKYSYPDWIIIGSLTKSDKNEMLKSRISAGVMIEFLKDAGIKIPIFVKDNCNIKNALKEYPESMKYKV